MKPVLVTTEYRGVFFGYLEKIPEKRPADLTLKNARNCIYWSADCEGFLGLAAKGPTKDCRIGAKVDSLTLYGITSITPSSESAAKAWESATWK